MEQDTERKDQLVYAVDSFMEGISIGERVISAGDDPRDLFHLGVEDQFHHFRLRSRYALRKPNAIWELENHLARLSKRGVLGRSIIIFGASADPYLPFEGKFDVSMKFLQLFERYTPGLLIVQTRSPLVVIALPIFKKLGSRVLISMGIETDLDESISRFTPHLPKAEERFKAVAALRRFGLMVNINVAPLMPYGDWKGDARRFAVRLAEAGDYLHVRSIQARGDSARSSGDRAITQILANDRKFQWLRPDSAVPLISALEQIAPSKLIFPQISLGRDRQLSIFAA